VRGDEAEKKGVASVGRRGKEERDSFKSPLIPLFQRGKKKKEG